MTHKVTTSILLLVLLLFGNPTIQAQDLKCEIGPLQKQFGGTNWLVYACDDRKSVVFVTAPDNPAAPFYFIYYPKDGGYTLSGEGTGNKEATKATFDELKNMPFKEIQNLIIEAENA